MATLEELVVQLVAETQGLRSEMNAATKITQDSSKKMDKALAEFSKNSSKNMNFFQTALATATGFLGSQAVLGAFEKLKDAAGWAFRQLQEGMESAVKEQEALTSLANSMALAGTWTRQAGDDLAKFAGEMESLTGVGDDVIASNLAVLSSMTRLNSDGLMQLQRGALDLSAAMGIDLDTATKLVAKAADGNAAALKRYGIEIKTTGDKTKDLELVTTALQERFGGSAAGKMQTFSGAVLGIKNAWGNLVEEFGKAVITNEAIVFAFQEVKNILNELTESAADTGGTLRKGIAEGFIVVLEAMMSALHGINEFYKNTKFILFTLDAGVQTLYRSFMALGDVLDGNMESASYHMDKLTESTNRANQAANDLAKENALDEGLKKMSQVIDSARAGYAAMGDTVSEISPTIQGTASAVRELTAAEQEHQDMIKSFAEGLAQQTAALGAEIEFRRQIMENDRAAGNLSDVEAGAQRIALMQEQFALENQALIDAKNQGLITEQQFAAAKTALERQQTLISQKNRNDLVAAEAAANKQRIDDFKSTMGTIAGLSQSGNKELAAIGKAAAITNATIDGYAAVQKALASAPPPFNFGLAALVGAATAANVAKIAGVGLKTGIDSVPGTGSRDNFPAVLAPGERVVPTKTNQDLTEFLANQGGGGNANITINVNVAPGAGITREGAASIVEALNDYLTSGGLKLMGV